MGSKRTGVNPLAYQRRRKSDSWLIRQRRKSGSFPPVEPVSVHKVVDCNQLPDTLIVPDEPYVSTDPYSATTREWTVEELWRMLEIDAKFELRK